MLGVLIKIAFRNLKEHKAKTLIIGVLITLGIAILVVGNSFTDTIKKGIEKNYIQNYTGNLFIASSAIKDPSLIISNELFESTPKILPDFPAIQKHVESLSEVTGTTGQINGVALGKWNDVGESFMILFGLDSTSYQNLFPTGVKLTDGEFLKEGESGIVLSKMVADMFKQSSGNDIQVGDSIVLTSMNTVSGAKIREVTVKGIHDYGDASFDLSYVCFIDQDTLRILNGMVLNTANSLNLTGEEASSLGALDEESLFGSSPLGGDDAFFVSDSAETESSFLESSVDDWTNILGDTSQRAFLNETDPNAWNYLLVKVTDQNKAEKVVKELNTYFTDNNIEAKAWNWLDGAGMSAQLADTLSIVFNVLLFVIAIVAVIVIMNTLVISVSERYGEIGTMRAIGAKKSFVRQMISLETLMITLVFGVIGVILGIIILLVLRGVGIQAPNQFMQILLGGDVFRPVVSFQAIVLSLITVSVVGLIASLYPVSVALKVSPLEAMNKG
ncbi:ABC-type transport system, involved in lipoprotein release, permease component [Sphaerochaeta pleomorpha str. Grapes]|uniref:ABC-type transport system, involved in lipoprotein release, permease component n=1 Tax=Sphaerochaeta pleomorpha (strain ATCC BAA-1885 / DSM 22778 / Grapes) TaxID=158190 RepID=G8QX81_SPHPG|nr:FtsX-like permease family protein [Sphaerochaeta pleomorpha]AEV30666.1 ABC-type transport system, involved in lipoprotein release, permease component [Sphaerochaeta pleomorpha str. Grapes]